jgi:hypothetical protein
VHVTGRDRHHRRLERRRLNVERVVSGLRFRYRHATAHQFRQDLGRVHRVHHRIRLEIPQLVGARFALHQGEHRACIEHRPIGVAPDSRAASTRRSAINSSDRFTPSGMYLRSKALARRSPWALVSTTSAPSSVTATHSSVDRIRIAPRKYRVPDVCVYKQPAPRDPIPSTPPFIAIEILSPEDRMSRVRKKIDEYLAFGVAVRLADRPGAPPRGRLHRIGDLRSQRRCAAHRRSRHRSPAGRTVPGAG